MPKKLAKPELTQSQIELEARDKRRLETFIDAVFAVAITLLGLGLVVPIVQHSNEVLSASLVSMGPKFIGYFLAFALLGILLNKPLETISECSLCRLGAVLYQHPFPVVRRARPICDDSMDYLSRHYCWCNVLPLRYVHNGAHSLRKLVVRETT
jgi:hypothetical protein